MDGDRLAGRLSARHRPMLDGAARRRRRPAEQPEVLPRTHRGTNVEGRPTGFDTCCHRGYVEGDALRDLVDGPRSEGLTDGEAVQDRRRRVAEQTPGRWHGDSGCRDP